MIFNSTMKPKFSIFLLILLAFFACKKKDDAKGDQQEITSERVFDQAELLSDLEKSKLTTLIKELERNVGSQIAILTVDTLNGEKMEEFSLRTFTKMNLGRNEYADGILIVLSVKDRKIRIEVGVGLERIVKDEVAARINREIIVPKYREGKYYEGFYAAVVEIKNLIEGNKQLVGKAPN